MAIPTERASTDLILQDSRFHWAALIADPEAKHLAGASKESETALRRARRDTEGQEDTRTEKLALLLRSDFELDDLVRTVHLKILIATGKDRSDPLYRAALPHGLSALISRRGEEQAREIKVLIGVLKERAPDIATAHGQALEQLAEQSIEAEQAWRDSETAVAHTFGAERIARADLIRQMQRNEGALLTLYPGQKRRVRSFFRPTRRRGAASDTGQPESTETPDTADE